jgi:glutathione S-transferase
MQLYGSQSSPFVRRLRLLLAGQSYEFVSMNIFESVDREKLIKLNPARKVPMLQDGEQVIFDSGVIYRYLSAKFGFTPLSWDEENTLTLINAVNDSLVEVLLCQRSGFDTNDNKLFFNLQRERSEAVLKVLEQKAQAGEFLQWNYLAMSLFALLDWAEFRKLIDLTAFSALNTFVAQAQQHNGVSDSDPRLS